LRTAYPSSAPASTVAGPAQASTPLPAATNLSNLLVVLDTITVVVVSLRVRANIINVNKRKIVFASRLKKQKLLIVQQQHDE